MKYAHFADLHLGSWREQPMRDLSTKAFLQAMDECIVQKVDFILFAGDLFNTSLPSLDTLKIVTKKLKELHDLNIPLYVIAGSHDFSPSGKTMVDVLEQAGLLENVCKGHIDPDSRSLHLKFTQDPKTGVKMTGIVGRKGQLDQRYYENLSLEHLEREEGYKIFLFHTTISELLAQDMAMIESQPLSVFPRGFDYYAGGHIHHPAKVEQEGYKCATYPGALFPNNFAEVEKYGKGGYYLISVDEQGNEQINGQGKQNVEWKPLAVAPHQKLVFDCQGKSPHEVSNELLRWCESIEAHDAMVTLRLKGILREGHVGEIRFRDIFEKLYQNGAYFVMKNTVKVQNPEFEQIMVAKTNSEEIEEEVIREHRGQNSLIADTEYISFVTSMLGVLNTTKREGETVPDFQKRIEEDLDQMWERKIIDLEKT
ncbi:exonuclease SbcCD subunit D [Candidatus Woesearchaeota archaeon]|nr:exonuclease SbcCD subunit D [Candidatus Woesearchaeota archaeon]